MDYKANDGNISVELFHGRGKKRKAGFKAVIRNVIITATMVSTVASVATPAHASNSSIRSAVKSEAQGYVQQYGVSFESAYSAVLENINIVKEMKRNGSVSSSTLQDLATSIYTLEKAYNESSNKDLTTLKGVLDAAEDVISGLSNADKVHVAISSVRANLGLDEMTVKQSLSNANITFTDVQQGTWYYDAVMAMAQKGLVNGVGNNQFAPDKVMTRAEFLTVIMRATYGSELSAMKTQEGAAWYSNAYTLALEKGILKRSEFDSGNLTVGCSRQEMSLLLIRAYEAQGNRVDQLVDTSKIADWNSIGTYYREYVLKAYSLGLITGVDSKGTFSPQVSLPRSQASTVLYRLVEPTARAKVDFSVTPAVVGGSQVFSEYEQHEAPRKGDTIIASNGQKYVIEEKWGVLGANVNADIWSGTNVNGYSLRVGGTAFVDGTTLIRDDTTGQVHSTLEWKEIRKQSFPSNMVGDIDGEVYNTFWKWNADMGRWSWIGASVIGQ